MIAKPFIQRNFNPIGSSAQNPIVIDEAVKENVIGPRAEFIREDRTNSSSSDEREKILSDLIITLLASTGQFPA